MRLKEPFDLFFLTSGTQHFFGLKETILPAANRNVGRIHCNFQCHFREHILLTPYSIIHRSNSPKQAFFPYCSFLFQRMEYT
jgi:hypothetical protein